MRYHRWSEDAVEDRDRPVFLPAPRTEKAQGRPVSQPRETPKSRSSSPEMAPAAGTPSSECLAPTNRSTGKPRPRDVQPAQSESHRPLDFRVQEKPRVPLHSPATCMPRSAVAQRDQKLFVPRGGELASHSLLQTTLVRDTPPAATCNSVTRDCQAETSARHWWRGGSTRRNPNSRECRKAEAVPLGSSERAIARLPLNELSRTGIHGPAARGVHR